MALALSLVLSLCACGQKASAWQEQYDLGVRYLSEGNYEEAIIAFTAVIEIDPKNADAYLGRANAYIGSGETEENLAAALEDYQSVLELDDRDTYSTYDENGSLLGYVVDQYDEEWNQIGEKYYDSEGNLTSSTVNE